MPENTTQSENMKNKLLPALLICLSLFFLSCGGGENPLSCAKKYCALSAKLKNAATDEERIKARKERNDYENELEKTHKGDKDFFKNFEQEVEKCGGGG